MISLSAKLYRFYSLFISAMLLSVIASAQVNKPITTHGAATRTSVLNFTEKAAYEKINPPVLTPRAVPNNEMDEEEMPENNFTPADAPVIYDNVPFQSLSRTQMVSVTPPPVINFPGIPDNGSIIPPDVHGAVGPNHLMETLNSQVRIFDRNGTEISTVSLDGFWSSLGSPSSFDPKIAYDIYANRWIIVTPANGVDINSAIMVGVSLTNDPTGTWKLYYFDVDPTNQKWFDFPSFGFNKNWIVVQGNMFNLTGGGGGSQVYAFDKADMYASGIGNFTKFTGSLFTAAPALTYSATQDTMFLVENWNSGAAQLRLYSITGAVGSEIFTTVATITSTGGWNSGGGNFAPQLGSVQKIEIGDSRIANVVYRNGTLWVVHTAFLPAATPTHAAIQWWQLSTTGTVIQKGRIEDSFAQTISYGFPHIAVNAADDALIGYCRFSPSIYPASEYALRRVADPVNIFEKGYIYKNGEAWYFKDFGTGRNRWGDYTAACIDPLNDTTMWVLGEYAKSPSSSWSTWWAKVDPLVTEWVDFNTDSIVVCNGTPIQLNDLSTIAATSWLWTFQNATPSTSTLQNPVVTFNGAGTHNVSLVVNGTDSAVKPGYIIVLGAPLPNIIITGDTTFCQGDSVSLSAIGAITYLWNNGETTRKIYADTSGTYYCVMTGSNGCTSTSWSVTVTVNPLPSVSLDPFVNACTVDPPFALIGGNPSGGAYSGTGVSAGVFDPSAAGAGTFAISYTYTDINGCSNSATQNITVDVCAGINTVNDSYSLNIKPVPAKNFLEVKFKPKSATHLSLRIVNQLGQQVFLKEAGMINTFNEKLDVHTLSDGIYFLDLTTDTEKLRIKVVIE